MIMKNKICTLFGIKYPIIQGGMIWCSGWKLAAAVSNAGGLGLIGAGSMRPDELRENIIRCKAATDKPFGVNIPLLYPDVKELLKIIILEEVSIVFTSAGNPKEYTSYLQRFNIKVAHVVSNLKFAKKSEVAGVDAVVVEGFEAGGHNGYQENTTLNLLQEASNAIEIPIIAAGGIASGKAMFAMMALGADGVQMGSRFVASVESSAHQNFKQMVVNAKGASTKLVLKQIGPVRLLKNNFYDEVRKLEKEGASEEDLTLLLGTGRAKKGMYEGDLIDGELEIGQVTSLINDILPASEIIENMLTGAYLKRNLKRDFAEAIFDHITIISEEKGLSLEDSLKDMVEYAMYATASHAKNVGVINALERYCRGVVFDMPYGNFEIENRYGISPDSYWAGLARGLYILSQKAKKL